jgi:hypothetical protein
VHVICVRDSLGSLTLMPALPRLSMCLPLKNPNLDPRGSSDNAPLTPSQPQSTPSQINLPPRTQPQPLLQCEAPLAAQYASTALCTLPLLLLPPLPPFCCRRCRPLPVAARCRLPAASYVVWVLLLPVVLTHPTCPHCCWRPVGRAAARCPGG